jgi:hypothetical protein
MAAGEQAAGALFAAAPPRRHTSARRTGASPRAAPVRVQRVRLSTRVLRLARPRDRGRRRPARRATGRRWRWP